MEHQDAKGPFALPRAIDAAGTSSIENNNVNATNGNDFTAPPWFSKTTQHPEDTATSSQQQQPEGPQAQMHQQESQSDHQQSILHHSWPPPNSATTNQLQSIDPSAIPQALQVNAGSQQARQGILLPTVNQLPMPASIGLPGIFQFAIQPCTATAETDTLNAPPIACANSLKSIFPTVADATHKSTNSDISNQSGSKRTVEEGAHSGKTGQKHAKLEPSVVSSYSSETAPVPQLTDVELEKLPPAERRRYERNMREQQRSYRISQQIKLLRDVLEENKVPFKPNKFSILVSVVEYIKQLQARAIMLDSEHQRLAQTIRQTNHMVASGQVPSSGEESQYEDTAIQSFKVPDMASSDFLVKGLDYQSVFDRCPSALGIASLDGRVLSCNPPFEELLSVQKDQLLQQSMFMYIRNHQDIFEAMADLLKRSSAASEAGDTPKGTQLLFWCGYVISLHSKKLAFSITLTNTASGDPKYFSLSASEISKQANT